MIEPTRAEKHIAPEALALVEIETAATKIWEHSLLTEKTIERRIDAKAKFENKLKINGLSSKSYFAVPHGSHVWIAGDDPDYDFNVFANNVPENDIESLGYHKIQDPLHMNIYNIKDLTNLNPEQAPILLDLLFTPNEYIAGNIALANMCRKNTAIYMDTHDSDIWEKKITDRFEQYYRGWPEDNTAIPGYSGNKAEERIARVNKVLELRGAHTAMGIDSYKSFFWDALRKFTLPTVHQYALGLSASNGALNIRNRAKAQRI
jgi:hypothetical protein